MSNTSYSPLRKLAAWAVHAYTASGVVAAFFGLKAIIEAQAGWEQVTVFWLLVAFFIDASDGMLARAAKVKEVLPFFSGKSMDFVIDFVNYAVVPALFLYYSDLIPEHLRMFTTIVVLLVSSIYYGLENMVSDDKHFVGFPVMWNFVVFYLFFVSKWPEMVNFIFVLVLCVMHFIPIKYIYPSQTKRFRVFNIGISVALIGIGIFILYKYPEDIPVLRLACSFILAYFGLMSLYNTFYYKEPAK